MPKTKDQPFLSIKPIALERSCCRLARDPVYCHRGLLFIALLRQLGARIQSLEVDVEGPNLMDQRDPR